MIIVQEIWHLKPGLEDKALELMQQMDDLVGPPAHVHPGWSGHASFYQSTADPTAVIMQYSWYSRELHEDLARDEEPRLQEFYQTYCSMSREIHYYTELPVEVEHEHESHR
jgi:hypothetical protein